LDVPSNIPDIFKKAMFWLRKNNSATKKRAVKVKIPSVVTSLPGKNITKQKKWRNLNIKLQSKKEKESGKKQLKRKEAEEKKRQKALQQTEKVSKKK